MEGKRQLTPLPKPPKYPKHLLMNLKEHARQLQLPHETYSSIKADLFGPSQFFDRPSILDAADESSFDDRMNNYMKEWCTLGMNAKRFAKWIEVRVICFVYQFCTCISHNNCQYCIYRDEYWSTRDTLRIGCWKRLECGKHGSRRRSASIAH